MFYKIIKKSFELIINVIYILQITLVFLAFFSVIYWILKLAQAPFVVHFAPFFEGINSFVHLFYNRTVEYEEATVDFSFIIASLLMIGTAWVLSLVKGVVKTIEEHFDVAAANLKSKKEASFNKKLESHHVHQEKKNKKFVIMVNMDAVDLSKDSFFNKIDPEDEMKIAKQGLRELCVNLSTALKFTTKVTDNGVLLLFDNFDDIDEILSEYENIVDKLRDKHKRQRRQLSVYTAFELVQSTDIYRIMLNLVNLKLENEIICMAPFKNRYTLIKKPQYLIDSKGIYKINGAEESVYKILNKKNVRTL